VRAASLPRQVEAVGTVRARTVAVVAPEVMGRVTQVLVREGDRVRKGDLLAVLDEQALAAQAAAAEAAAEEAEAAAAEAAAAEAQAEAQKVLAEKTYARFAKLNEERVVTQQEFDEVQARRTVAVRDHERALERRRQVAARVAAARAQARNARTLLSYARIAAPFDGVVTERRVDPGSLAVPGVPLFTVEDTRRYRVEARVPEEYAGVLRAGARVEILLDALPGRAFPGTVSEVVPAVDPASRTFAVKADVAAPNVRGGMSARLRFAAGRADVLSVPAKALHRMGGYDGVFVVGADNVARLVMVQTGRSFGGRVEILSGVEPGARVAVSGLERLADGVRVEAGR